MRRLRAKPNRLSIQTATNQNPLAVSQKEFTEANNFKRFLKRELRAMGIKEKFNVVVSQNSADFPANISQKYAEGIWPKGMGMYFAEYKSKRRQRSDRIKHVVGIWKPQREDAFSASNIRSHEIAHAAVAELLKKNGWIIVRKGYPTEISPFIEGLVISFHLERFAGNTKSTKRLLGWYTKNYRRGSRFDSHSLGLQLAKSILSAAPHSGAERRLLREKIAEAGFKNEISVYKIIHDLEDKRKARKILAVLKKAA